MKKALLFLFFISIGVSVFAQETSHRYYVHAQKGLSLRDAPSKEGKKIAIMPYGATLKSLPDATALAKTESMEGSDNQPLVSGSWMKVKYNGKEGYAFGGYLSKYKTPANGESAGMKAGYDILEGYYLKISKMKGDRKTEEKPNTQDYYTQKYEDGAVLIVSHYDGGSKRILDLPSGKMTMSEALVVFRSALFGADEVTKTSYSKKNNTISVTSDKKLLEITPKQDNKLEVIFSYAD